MEDQVRIARVEQKVDDFNSVLKKLDLTIEKLSEVNTTVSRMLAVHEERLSRSEEVDNVLFTKIDQLRDKMDTNNFNVLSRIQTLDRKVWTGVGIVSFIAFALHVNILRINLTQPPSPGTILSSYRN